jgi:hypothetical protein
MAQQFTAAFHLASPSITDRLDHGVHPRSPVLHISTWSPVFATAHFALGERDMCCYNAAPVSRRVGATLFSSVGSFSVGYDIRRPVRTTACFSAGGASVSRHVVGRRETGVPDASCWSDGFRAT